MALHACLHLGSSMANIRPVSSQRSCPQPPQPGWKYRGASRSVLPPGEDAESKGDNGDKWLPAKQTNSPTQKETLLWVQYICSSPQCSVLGTLWASLWAEMTSWPYTTLPGCSGRAWGSTATQLLLSFGWNPAGLGHKNLWRQNLETQDPRGKQPFPKITSWGHWLPSATRNLEVCAILIPVPTAPTWIWSIPYKQRQRDAMTVKTTGFFSGMCTLYSCCSWILNW